uniref:Secreted protein n=1 Tax=Steinernema glaseri TaxID=37863 RepID=A0A1I7Y5K4_9BILA
MQLLLGFVTFGFILSEFFISYGATIIEELQQRTSNTSINHSLVIMVHKPFSRAVSRPETSGFPTRNPDSHLAKGWKRRHLFSPWLSRIKSRPESRTIGIPDL